MFEQEMVGTLALVTLGAALLIAVLLWLRFMRKPENRYPMEGEEERNLGEFRRDGGGDDGVRERGSRGCKFTKLMLQSDRAGAYQPAGMVGAR